MIFPVCPHPLAHIFESALPSKNIQCWRKTQTHDSKSKSRAVLGFKTKAPQLATLKITLCSHFFDITFTKLSKNGWFVAAFMTQKACLDKWLLWGKLASIISNRHFCFHTWRAGQIRSGMQGPIPIRSPLKSAVGASVSASARLGASGSVNRIR